MCRVLVVDDQPENRAPIGEIFAQEGFDVAFADDGFHALDELIRRRPDLILSDIVMPRLDGVRFVELLRSQGIQLPVILMTAGAMRSQHQADALLQKPFDVDALMACVGEVLRERGVHCAARLRPPLGDEIPPESAGAEGYA